MKKSLNFALGLLFVGMFSSASAEVHLYYQSEFVPTSMEECWDIVSGKQPSRLLMRKDIVGDFDEFYLVEKKVYRFSMMQMNSAKNGDAFTLGCDVNLEESIDYRK